MPIGSKAGVQTFALNDSRILCGVEAIIPAAPATENAAALVRVRGPSDRCALYVSGVSASAVVGPNDSVQVEWAIYHGIASLMEQTPAGIWTPTYNPVQVAVREGLVGIAWGRPSTEWTIYARLIGAPARAAIKCNVAVIADNFGGATTPPGSFAGSQGT